MVTDVVLFGYQKCCTDQPRVGLPGLIGLIDQHWNAWIAFMNGMYIWPLYV